eukprot:TRINITY_DN9508_c0_g1_i3.p1 TRINITY_DN9508_c0_g1~~TRINITY_DN9508_c0_g1_i3.p1  ORF type:complete len:328 (+),score=60.77 TRINITY_DN9508_c0_g1_i3:129-1112(+)
MISFLFVFAGAVLAQYPYRATTFGEVCKFPFEEQGQEYTDCVTAGDGLDYCKVDGVFYECLPPIEDQYQNDNQQNPKIKPKKPANLVVVERFTRDGAECKLPILVKNKWLGDCLKVSATRELCVAGGKWQFCAPKEKDEEEEEIAKKEEKKAAFRFTIDGAPCSFPFDFGQKTFYDCVDFGDGVEMCRLNNEWKACAAVEDKTAGSEKTSTSETECLELPPSLQTTQPGCQSDNLISTSALNPTNYAQDYSTYDEQDQRTSQDTTRQRQQSGGNKDDNVSNSNTAVIIMVVLLGIVAVGVVIGSVVYFKMRQPTQTQPTDSKLQLFN